MRYHCYFCGKSVTTEMAHDSVIRAILVCPECIQAGKVRFPDDVPPKRPKGPKNLDVVATTGGKVTIEGAQ